MEVLVKCENGFRFSATCKGYTVTTGRGENGNQERDGMWAARQHCSHGVRRGMTKPVEATARMQPSPRNLIHSKCENICSA
jgi:hypothetical protein